MANIVLFKAFTLPRTAPRIFLFLFFPGLWLFCMNGCCCVATAPNLRNPAICFTVPPPYSLKNGRGAIMTDNAKPTEKPLSGDVFRPHALGVACPAPAQGAKEVRVPARDQQMVAIPAFPPYLGGK
jgi:hypothetical protein